ncbi:M20 metallopeptidase family protein [Jiulongibacter sediminis]|uniref:N-acyl-L-amino acid amidohydrolase n=1 Tax=Jiulongibacter sediminis TaxID=1605367 RepID=A0A0P7C628_9BACT|nr:M20 family metallopeptidase [Jiulongibacter sediminis]KPM49749.1 N-acyl-L-amino acid amidohydrolase [Jiulongibacter sediminis]TBX26785.1 N-acyl-L-amino acid amidohydrolase [Jiulongibacter sediminis]
MDLLEKVKGLAKDFSADSVAIRRHLHANPELSFEEYKTSAFVAQKLREMGLEPQEGVAGTGVVAMVKGKNPDKKVIGLRADMDALPILEANEVPYKSKNEGVMHACGHDVHTTSLLGTARILSQLKDDFEGTVKLVFQPGEEKVPGGASLMIKEGVLENPRPFGMIGQHVAPNLPVGKIGFREGMYMASTDEIYLTVKGKGGHGAAPDQCIDPILIASHIIVALQQIVSRNRKPTNPSVLTFGKIVGLGATNVIPNEVKIDGTFRNMNEEWRAKGLELIEKMAKTMAESMGGSCEVYIGHGYPYLENNPDLTRKMRSYATEFMGAENVVDLDLWMAGEDFAFYSQVIDSCFYRLGIRNEEKGIISGVHTPTFDIDEGAIEIGMGLMAWNALRELGEH